MLFQFKLIKAIYDSKWELYLCVYMYNQHIILIEAPALLEKSVMYLIRLSGRTINLSLAPDSENLLIIYTL
jgi:hypothetical protein